ncbi:MAG TPA: hypothetical protein ENN67_00850, partial [Firmicutes bacterium]|nr:hypothetical protein [Bacillota bacterium]
MKTESMEKSANEPGLSGTEVSTGLAPFEEESTILIDEYPLVGPFMLEEFERSNEIIEINELFGHSAQEESGSPDESAPEEIDNGEREKTDTEGDKATGVPPTPERVGSPFDEEGPIAGEPHSALPP